MILTPTSVHKMELDDDGGGDGETKNEREELVETVDEEVKLKPLNLSQRTNDVVAVLPLLHRRLLRRDWHGVRDLVSTMLQYAATGPIDIFKGASAFLHNQNTDPTNHIRFLRKFSDEIRTRGVSVQRLFSNELVSLEIAYYLCLQGRSEEALTHLRSVALEGSCSTNPLFQLYLGLLALQRAIEMHHKDNRDTMEDEQKSDSDETVSDVDASTLVAEAIKSLEAAHAQLPESDCILFYRLKALLYFSPSEENIENAKCIVDEFVERFPDHPIGHRIRIEFLQCFRPADYLALKPSVESLFRIDPMSDLAFSLSQQLYQEGQISEEGFFHMCLERLCYTRNDSTAWKLLADVLRNTPRDAQPSEHSPEKWWIDIHFRHPRQLSRELGLAAASDLVHANRLKVLSTTGVTPKAKSFASARLCSLRFLVDKCFCATYLLPTEHRFIQDTLASLELSGFVSFALEIARTCGLVKPKHK